MRASILAVTTALLAQPAAAQAPPIGVAEWINPGTVGRPPAADTRPVSSGTLVIERELVSTDTAGLADFTFADETRLLMGTGCEVVLDGRFYDRELDVEVTAMSFRTATRCISRIDNLVVSEPDGRLVIRARLAASGGMPAAISTQGAAPGTAPLVGEVAVERSSAMFAVASQPGMLSPIEGGSPMELLLVTAVRDGGFARLGDRTIRRPGFVAWLDADGRTYGPVRAPRGLHAALQSALEGHVQDADLPPAATDWVLTNVRDIVRVGDGLPPPLAEPVPSPGSGCVARECEVRTDDGQPITGILVDSGDGGVFDGLFDDFTAGFD